MGHPAEKPRRGTCADVERVPPNVEDRSNEAAEPSALDACAQLALAGDAFLARPFEP